MPTSILTATPYPASSASPNVPADLQAAVTSLEDNTIAYFSTAGARDTAFSNWTSAGNTMRDGLHCHVQGTGDMVYMGSTWVPVNKTLYRRIVATATGTLNGTVNLCAAQTIPAAPFGQGVPYYIDVDASCHASSLPAGLGIELDIQYDGVTQDGDTYTNGGTSACQYTCHARSAMTIADNSAHTVKATVTSLAGTITVDTIYSRMILLIRPYATF